MVHNLEIICWENNPNALALCNIVSSIISKVFKHIIAERLEVYLWTHDNQFGFKSGHSTDLCIYALSDFIEYFETRSTSVYAAFLDDSKAFDKISHWTLFRKLIDRGVQLYLVIILCYWYQKQEMTVRCGVCISNSFKVTNGIRQGGILSSQLFNIYIDGLSDILNKSSVGGSFGGKRINHMLMIYVLLVSSLLDQMLGVLCLKKNAKIEYDMCDSN